MNKLLLNVVPFILDNQYRNIKPYHNYTVEEINNIDLFELTELGLLVPGFLQPQNWKFKYSWATGPVKTISANPHVYNCPSPAVLDTIISRIENEGYAMFHTIRNHYLFLEWDWVFTGSLNNESFLELIKKGTQCCHMASGLYHKDGGLFLEEWDAELNDWHLIPLGVKQVAPDNQPLLKVIDFLAKEDVLKVVVK